MWTPNADVLIYITIKAKVKFKGKQRRVKYKNAYLCGQ